MPGVKFSQFVVDGNAVPGDQLVGIRAGSNAIFRYDPLTFSLYVLQTGHGLALNEIVMLSGANYILAQADAASHSDVVGIITQIIDANNFLMQFGGYVQTLIGATPGVVYFLSDTVPGTLTNAPSGNPGTILKPILIANTTTSGFWLNYNGQQL